MAASNAFSLFPPMVATLMLFISAIGEISIANRISPAALPHGTATRLQMLSFPGGLLRKKGAIQHGIREVLKPEGQNQFWRANNSDGWERLHPTRGWRGRSAHNRPAMNMADKEWQYFQAALSALVSPNTRKLQELRQRVSRLESQLEDAMHNEDYKAAARLRDEVAVLLPKDPAVLSSSLRKSMEEASKRELYDKASMYRDQLNILKLYLPECNLAGRWQGESRTRGVISIRIGYDSDTLVATNVDGEVFFTTDVSEPDVDSRLSRIFQRIVTKKGNCFPANGKLAGERFRGEIHVASDDAFGLLYAFIAERGGLATAGASGEPRGFGKSDEDEELEFVSFRRLETSEDPQVPWRNREYIKKVAGLERLFNQYGGDEG